MEVATARVYNWDIGQKRKEEAAAAWKEKSAGAAVSPVFRSWHDAVLRMRWCAVCNEDSRVTLTSWEAERLDHRDNTSCGFHKQNPIKHLNLNMQCNSLFGSNWHDCDYK
jgi:hypothetical protein